MVCLFLEEKQLKLPVDDESFMKRFLRPKKYYPESTFEMVSDVFEFYIGSATLYVCLLCFR